MNPGFMDPDRRKRPRVNSTSTYDENTAALAGLMGFQAQPGAAFDCALPKRYDLKPTEEVHIFFDLLLNLAGKVSRKTWHRAIDEVARHEAKTLALALERTNRQRANEERRREKCPYCRDGNLRIRSSVNSDVWVHTDTPAGRQLCHAQEVEE